MSNVLSQNEIDALLNALSSGDVESSDIEADSKEKSVKAYDFSRPDKFSKEQLRTLEIIHDNLGRLVNNFLSAYLRSYIDVAVLSTQSMVYSEFSNSVSNPAILCIIDFAPLEGQIMLEVSSDVAFTVIEKLLGGPGKVTNLKENRELTEIESVLIKNIVVKVTSLMKEAWANIIELKPILNDIETNAQFAQIVSPNDSIALVTYKIQIGESEGMLNVAIPHYVIEPILGNLSSKLWFSGGAKKEKSEAETDTLLNQLGEVDVPLRAVIGSSIVSVEEFVSLSRGDILVLDSNREQPLNVYVKEELKFLAQPGVVNNKMAIKIIEVIDTDGGIEYDG